MYAVGRTDIGKVRLVNEDSIFVSNEHIGSLPNLYIIADGMGGHKAGEIASAEAINSFKEYISNNSFEDSDILDFMISATKYANNKIHEKSINDNDLSGMGTTLSACAIKNGKLYIAHVGDSRVYKINKNTITQITTDHTYINEMIKLGQITLEQARNHPNRNVITRALGIESEILIDGVLHEISEDDKIMICSDGLTNMLTDEDILKYANQGEKFLDIVNSLVDEAIKKGGDDNISVIVIGNER